MLVAFEVNVTEPGISVPAEVREDLGDEKDAVHGGAGHRGVEADGSGTGSDGGGTGDRRERSHAVNASVKVRRDECKRGAAAAGAGAGDRAAGRTSGYSIPPSSLDFPIPRE